MADASTGAGRLPIERASLNGGTTRGSGGHEHDVPPDAVRDAALRAFDQRIPGARIADAMYDSWVVDANGVVPPGPRMLRFSCPGRVIEVGVFPGPGVHTLRLRTTPAAVLDVEVRQQAASVTFRTDREGILAIEPSPSGVLCFVVRAEGEPPVQTAWVRV